MSKCPAISVVLSVYNGARFLEEALVSIENQTFTDFEIIVINDGSTDETDSILSKRAKLDPRYRIFNQSNKGLIASLNLGVQSARADLIARMDADDISEPERFAQQVGYLNANPSIALLGTAIRLINAEGKISELITYPSGSQAISTALLTGCAFAHPSVIIKKDVLILVGCYREVFKHAEDYDLWLRVIELYEADNMKEPLLRYRVHGGNISTQHERAQQLSAHVARACAISRRAGKPESIENLHSSVRSDELLTTLDKYPALKASFFLESLKLHFNKNITERTEKDFLEAEESLEAIWKYRHTLKRRRLVRLCIMPFIFHSWDTCNKGKIFRWLIRSLRTDPFTTFYSFFINIFLKLRPAN